MKHLVFTLLAALLVSGAASAQRLMVGVRGGVNFTDYSFVPTRIGDIRFSPGSPRAGYDVGFVLRLNLSKHLHLQSELDYAFVNYSVRAGDAGNRRLTLRTERFEIPVQLGFQFGVLRLFGGALFRVTDSERSSAPQLLRVRFNNGDIGVMGGLGFTMSILISGLAFASASEVMAAKCAILVGSLTSAVLGIVFVRAATAGHDGGQDANADASPAEGSPQASA